MSQISGQVTVTSAGTAVQASSTLTGVRRYFLKPDPGNTGNIYVGNNDADVSATGGVILEKTHPGFLWTGNLTMLYVDSAEDGDILCWMIG